MNKFQKIACNLARYEINNPNSIHKEETFNQIRNNYYNINMKSKRDVKDAIGFKNFIKGRE